MDKALNFPPLARSQGTATAEPTGVRPGMAETDPTQELDLELVCRAVGQGYLLGLDPEDMSARARAAGGYQHIRFEDLA